MQTNKLAPRKVPCTRRQAGWGSVPVRVRQATRCSLRSYPAPFHPTGLAPQAAQTTKQAVTEFALIEFASLLNYRMACSASVPVSAAAGAWPSAALGAVRSPGQRTAVGGGRATQPRTMPGILLYFAMQSFLEAFPKRECVGPTTSNGLHSG